MLLMEPDCPLFVLYISLTVIFYVFYFSEASSPLSTTPSPSPTTLSGANYTAPQNVTRVTAALSAENSTMIQSTTGDKYNYRNISNFPVLHLRHETF